MEISTELKQALSSMGKYKDIPFKAFYMSPEMSDIKPLFSDSLLRAHFLEKTAEAMYTNGLKVSIGNIMIFQSIIQYIVEPGVPLTGTIRFECFYSDKEELKFCNTGFLDYCAVRHNSEIFLTHIGVPDEGMTPLSSPNGDSGLELMKFLDKNVFNY